MSQMRVRWRCIFMVFFICQVFIGFWYILQVSNIQEIISQRFGTPLHRSLFYLTDLNSDFYYKWFDDDFCVKEGTFIEKSRPGHCACKPQWKGKRCGIPKVIQNTSWVNNLTLFTNLQIRSKPRRIILAVLFQEDFDVFEANVFETSNLIDVFLIGDISEINSPNFNKESKFIRQIKEGFLSEHKHKFIYIPIYNKDVQNISLHEHLINVGLKLISDIRPDDILMFSDGNEIFQRNILVFLKTFRNYPLPFQCIFDEYLYGFFYKVPKSRPNICGITIHLLSNAFEYKLSRLEKGIVYKSDVQFFENANQPIISWIIPSAGWKCSFCVSPDKIFHKVLSMSQDKMPEWFKNSSSSITFINRLIKFGQNIYLEPIAKFNIPLEKDLPHYISRFKDKFRHLLSNPFELLTLNNIELNIIDDQLK